MGSKTARFNHEYTNNSRDFRFLWDKWDGRDGWEGKNRKNRNFSVFEVIFFAFFVSSCEIKD